ncbi:hypothetical protein M770_34335 (plasmid) [Pseudomonas aeruginosa VRFPA03]|nr:hypothetical protein M770_34335 [Pseudomonas aeruginosa VRFPA03]
MRRHALVEKIAVHVEAAEAYPRLVGEALAGGGEEVAGNVGEQVVHLRPSLHQRRQPGDHRAAGGGGAGRAARAALARSLDRKAPPKAPAAWSSEEVEFIRRHGSKRSLAWCAYMLGRSYQSVASKAEELSPHSQRDRNNAIWSKSEEDLLRQHYQQRGSLWCAQQTGKTRAAVFHRAKKLGLQRQRPKHP